MTLPKEESHGAQNNYFVLMTGGIKDESQAFGKKNMREMQNNQKKRHRHGYLRKPEA